MLAITFHSSLHSEPLSIWSTSNLYWPTHPGTFNWSVIHEDNHAHRLRVVHTGHIPWTTVATFPLLFAVSVSSPFSWVIACRIRPIFSIIQKAELWTTRIHVHPHRYIMIIYIYILYIHWKYNVVGGWIMLNTINHVLYIHCRMTLWSLIIINILPPISVCTCISCYVRITVCKIICILYYIDVYNIHIFNIPRWSIYGTFTAGYLFNLYNTIGTGKCWWILHVMCGKSPISQPIPMTCNGW
jgi:hypothetical protein